VPIKQKVQERGTTEAGDCVGVVHSVTAVYGWEYRPVECSVSYKRVMDTLNTTLSSLQVFTAALLFRCRR